MYRTITIEGRCDKTRYVLELTKEEEIYRVQYRDLSIPKPYGMVSVTNALSSYRVPPNAKLLRAEVPEEAPTTEGEAYWYVRACYEHTRRPIFYHLHKLNKLICFPPPANSGDEIVVGVQALEQRGVSDYEQMDVIDRIFNSGQADAKMVDSA